jgi:hypothetical protein
VVFAIPLRPTELPPVEYLRRAAVNALLLAVCAVLIVATKSTGNLMPTAIAAIATVRYFVAYRRASKRAEGAQ